LQELVKLGVDLSCIEKKAGLAKFVLKLDFEKNINNHIQFLHDLGVPSNELGTFLTHNPLIFKESLDDLQVRVNYLESKKFSKDAITRIVSKAPFWLSFSTKRIDRRLGFFQKEFQLTGDELRHVVTRLPKLALWGLHKVKQTNFSIKEEMGFSQEETKLLLIEKPKIWLVDRPCLLKKFDLIHNTMNIPHKQILRYPGVLLKREFLVRQRHLFLEKLGRAQYNPNEPQYVPLKALVAGTDAEFCNKYAKTSLHIFNEFLKTL
ncbi:mitochondrial transcription termination factor 3, partial [Tachypleus tridentatus]|uniref:mitochondrial transcription termination factor 3 n=1 Tax=Tachypleus tridentatus TaxID=6853 RepID=UPI003FD68373